MPLPLLMMAASPAIATVAPADDYSRCKITPTDAKRSTGMRELLRRQGATLELAGATTFRRIGDLRTGGVRYSFYYYVHDTPTAGSCHGIDAIVVLRGDRYVGSYAGIGSSVCRVDGDALICRDTYFGRDFRVRFVRGKPPLETVIGGYLVVLRR